jgi:hypothetical protein
MALPEGAGKLTSGVTLSAISERFHLARRTKWRKVRLTFGVTELYVCPDFGCLVLGAEGRAAHLEAHRLDHYHDDMPDDDQQEE